MSISTNQIIPPPMARLLQHWLNQIEFI